ncbi:Noc2-domain-containing protein [Dendrothele bispora CBS 962.96]|uniref:Noc2-domain-containing protein n=1 Tax=Dendrothele bispora (strain CBS 962.96) TaxID=1314807 RepID=A0A4V4HF80_DENBC|nr:Noc2-domain-containing protein [Dendrothele bispora CBS 962.96]
MGKATKSMKKFAASGQLKKTIEARRKHQHIKKKLQARRRKGTGVQSSTTHDGSEEDEELEDSAENSNKGKMTVNDLLGGAFIDDSEDEDNGDDASDGQDDISEDEDDIPDDVSFGSVDDLDDEGQNHLIELSKLAEKDPEFYKYLQENDKELLEFDPDGMQEDPEDMGEVDDNMEVEGEQLPVLTIDILKKWQKALLEQRSLRALRKLLIAFRAAAHMNEEGQVLAWSIDSPTVYNKLVTTALKYTPVILEHHVPYKTQTNGKIKSPTQTQKFKTLQKLILSYFHNVIHLLSQLTDGEMVQLAVSESSKIIPYIISSRKAVKLYLKKCLELWSSADDNTRIYSFLAIRKLASTNDQAILDNVLKGTYLTLVRTSKTTSIHTLPSINFMKNSASEVFCLDQATAYQHAFGYIRQLAILLRNSMKIKTKEAFKQVYNWQYVHSLDFWSLVLARACDATAEGKTKESELEPLIYPLVQVSLGAIKLIANSRSYPFHLHVIRSLLHLTRHTQVYIPIAPYLLPILTGPLMSSSQPKNSTLRPLDLEVQIRTPQQYLKTRVYLEGLIDEVAYLLAEWLSTKSVHGSIAFPEIVVPIVVALKKTLKHVKAAPGSFKELGSIKTLLERIEESAKWVEQKRTTVRFAPGQIDEVSAWEQDMKSKVDGSPLGKYMNVQRRTREKKRKMIEKARQGEGEMLED